MIFLRFTFATALGCALMAGVFFAFSTAVMPALARLQPSQGIAAMNSMITTVYNGWFMGALFGTAALCFGLIVAGIIQRQQPGAWLIVAGSAIYLLGSIGTTAAFNEPLNNALAAVTPDTTEAGVVWSRYLAEWTTWNHVRAGTCLLAAALQIAGLLLWG